MNCPPPLNILVIEDDADTRANLQDILELDDHATATAGTIQQAFQYDDWAQLDAIILDRKLPDGMAEDLLARLKELAPQAAIVIVTGFADVEGAITALRRGASDYILKPISADALRTTLRRIAESKRAERELNQRAEQQAVVAELSYLALQSADLSKLLSEMSTRIVDTLNVEFSEILELLSGENGLLLRAGAGWKPGLVGRWTVEGGTGSQAGYTLHTQAPVIVDDLRQESRFSISSLLHEYAIVSGMSVVIHGDQHPYGVLGAHTIQSRQFTKSDVSFLQAIANVLAAAIKRMKTEEQTRQEGRLAAIGQMVTGLAHESRNALQRSQACLEMLELELENQPEALALVSRIQRAQDHLYHLYEEVRGYATPINLRRRPCDVRRLWRDTWSHLEVVRGKNKIQLNDQCDDAECVCEVDPHALEQVFRNLLENAISACIEAKSSEPARITIACTETEFNLRPALQIVIRDNGPGICEVQQDRVFEPFYTTQTQGTGLGLAITKRIVEAHGGQIRICSASPRGAQVSMTLPKTAP